MSEDASAASESAPNSGLESAPNPASGRWLVGAIACALLQVLLAGAAWILSVSQRAAWCPGGSEGSFGCAAIFRPRVGALGPIHLSKLALAGSILTLVALVGLRLQASPSRGARRFGLAIPVLGAGLALGAQVLGLSATGSLCVVCAALATVALGAALCATRHEADPGERRRLLLALALVALLASGAGLARGIWLRSDDAARELRLSQLGGGAGPSLLLVERPGCHFCETLALDVLADPSLEDVWARTRGLERIGEDDPRAKAHAGGPGAPVLIALAPDGSLLGRLRGAEPLVEVRAFLSGVAPVASR